MDEVQHGPHIPDNDELSHFVNVAKLSAPHVDEQKRKEQQGTRTAHLDILNDPDYHACLSDIHKWQDRVENAQTTVNEELLQLTLRQFELKACQSALDRCEQKRKEILVRLSGASA